MSTDNKPVGDSSDQESVVAGEKNDFVRKKAYEEVTTDMHKFKASLKSEKARAAEYEAKLKALEEERMRENDQWKELAEKYKAEATDARQDFVKSKEEFNKNTKKQALKDQLGLSNDKYLVHANVDAIEVNEYGVIDQESLLAVANEFREEHGILLNKPAGANSTMVPASPIKTIQKELSQMTTAEKRELLKQVKS